MSARGSGAAAVTIRTWSPGSYRGLHYGELLTALDRRVDRLYHQKDLTKRLIAGAELLVGLLSFAEELTGRMWSIRGALGLEQVVE